MKNGDTVRLTLGDWQWNAAVIGFINIVGRENVSLTTDTVEFSVKQLEGFEEKYFAYFIKAYEKTLSWHKIIAFKDRMEAYANDEFERFNLESLKTINIYIKDVKRYLKSNSYQSAYELIAADVEMLFLEKQLAPLKELKSEQQFAAEKEKVVAEVKAVFAVLEQIIAYCESPQGKRYITAKNVIYTVINNGWSGVSFLNAQTKEKDMYADYKIYFVEEAINYLRQDKSRFKYRCFICDEPIKDLSHDLSFLNATGFDVARKSSHVWNFQNDIALCPLCKLVYSCLPAGMTYVYDRGIYINANESMERAFTINFQIKNAVLGIKDGSVRSVYPVLVSALHKKEHDASKYELADIQVVRYENGSYRFNILSRKMLKIIIESKDELDRLVNTVLLENKQTLRIYDEVIALIFNNHNLFVLIHRLLYYKLTGTAKCYFNGMHVTHLLTINQRIYTCLGGMKVERREQGKESLIWKSRNAGFKLKNRYSGRGAQHKLPGICHRLLNALKTGNQEIFLDVALNCHLYAGLGVPDVIINALRDDKDFATMGYAFVSGLIDESGEKENMAPEADKEEIV